jgi:nitroreductase
VPRTEKDFFFQTSDALKGYGDFMKSKISTLPEEKRNTWTAKQTYLALGNLLNVAAELRIDVTPMEGFEPAQFNEILGLEAMNLNAAVVATIGYRDETDDIQHYTKVRKSNEELFLTL